MSDAAFVWLLGKVFFFDSRVIMYIRVDDEADVI